ncbi:MULTISPECIES: potassium channel family protein [unclassified Streptomyces]|uniref:potassium channel family protein n=1 Tax=unclassified Streptomyces TaxID=2593676 RepID=UPI002E2A3343|nr:potassium channel family protein [Streptomyces sp. NBC_00223]
MVAAYFLLPLNSLGPRHPQLSWALFMAALVLVAVLLLRHIRDVLVNRPGARPGMAIPLLMCLSVLVFAAGYFVLAKQPGQFSGLRTRVDALYFTIVTLATVGYGDITPVSQTARLVDILQIVYSFVFLTAAATALTQRLRYQLGERSRSGPHSSGRDPKP